MVFYYFLIGWICIQIDYNQQGEKAPRPGIEPAPLALPTNALPTEVFGRYSTWNISLTYVGKAALWIKIQAIKKLLFLRVNTISTNIYIFIYFIDDGIIFLLMLAKVFKKIFHLVLQLCQHIWVITTRLDMVPVAQLLKSGGVMQKDQPRILDWTLFHSVSFTSYK